jgi:RNA polymerase sigma-70 factor
MAAAPEMLNNRPIQSDRNSTTRAGGLSGEAPASEQPRLPSALVKTLYAQAVVPPEWRLTVERFGQALERSAAKSQRFCGEGTTPGSVIAYFDSLRLHDLALACACSEGSEAAWEHFMNEYRPELYRAARAIAGDAQGRDLADSLYAQLYGLGERDGQRRSLFDYFYGRSKLTTWLRAVLAQRHVDELRRTRRTESLDGNAEGDPPREFPDPATIEPPDSERAKYLAILQAELSLALSALPARDRLRLSCYYIQELTLAQIGRLLGEHEATVSRKLDRLRRELREQVDRALRQKNRLSDAQVKLCYEYAKEEWPFDLAKILSSGASSK